MCFEPPIGDIPTKLGRFTTSSLALAAALTIGILTPPPAKAAGIGLLILEGSDSQTIHGLDPYSTNFLNGMSTFSTTPWLPNAILTADPTLADLLDKKHSSRPTCRNNHRPAAAFFSTQPARARAGAPGGGCAPRDLGAAAPFFAAQPPRFL